MMAFIVFEGLDGSGKSTLINGLKAELDRQNRASLVTREPGGSPLGDEVRELLLRVKGDAPTPRAELLLYEAVRAQHVEKTISPALKQGKWVLCDRFDASSLAFQGGGRNILDSEIIALNQFATGGLKPDLYVLLDLSVEESLRRMKRREAATGQTQDRFEQEKQDFHERVRQAYLKIAKAEGEKWLVLSADQSPEDLLKSLMNEVRKRQWLK